MFLFFALLFTLALLGDGKQPIGDVVAAAGILGLFLVQRMKGKIIVRVPALLNTVWAAFLLYLIIRTVFSDSVGYSVSATIRWIMAYPVFVLFASQGKEEKEKNIFSSGLLIFS